MRIKALDHVQLAMPSGREADARAFYSGLLGIPETVKPPQLARRGGCWFERGDLKIHLGVEADFRPARKAHPALIVEDLPALKVTLAAAGFALRADEPLAGYDRILWMIRSAIGSNFWSRHAPDNLELRAGAGEIQSRSRTGKLRTARSAAQCIRPHLRNTKARTNP
jgi:hypothetical protein